MTLIVGIKCTEGVVVGSDGAATLGNATGTRTVIQPANKLHILQGRIIMGVSGQVGLSQLYCDRVESLWKDKKLGIGVTLPQVQRELCRAIQQDAIPAIQRAKESIPFLGQGGAFALASTNHWSLCRWVALRDGPNSFSANTTDKPRPQLKTCPTLQLAADSR